MEYFIRNYFKLKKDKILEMLNKWESEYDIIHSKK